MMLKKFQDAFETAEKHLKEAELFVKDMAGLSGDDLQGLLFPAVNELRYAGFHASKALTLDGDDRKEAYESAERHCRRACYDAIDVQIQYCLCECRRFQNDYRLVLISEVIKDYQDDCLKLNRIKSEPRSEDRRQDWEKLLPVIGELKEIHQKWFVGREELNKILEEKREARWNQFFNNRCTLIAAISAAVSALCAVYVLFSK